MRVKTFRSHCLRRFFPWTGVRHVESAINGTNTGNTSTCGDRAIASSDFEGWRALGVDRGAVAKTLSQIQNQPPVGKRPPGLVMRLSGPRMPIRSRNSVPLKSLKVNDSSEQRSSRLACQTRSRFGDRRYRFQADLCWIEPLHRSNLKGGLSCRVSRPWA